MLIPLTITIAAGLLMLAAIFGAAFVARRLATEGGLGLPSSGWRWYPSALGLLLIPLAVLLLWRFFPALLFLPIIIPFFLRRGGGFRNIFRFPRRDRNGDDEDDRRSGGNGHPRRGPWR